MTVSKKITAASVAAPKAHSNEAMKQVATDYTAQASSSVGKLQLTAALKGRAILESDVKADIGPLARAFGSRRKAELIAVVAASAADLDLALAVVPGKGHPGLQQTARALKLIGFGVDDLVSKAAKEYISRGGKSAWYEATGQAPEVEPKAKDSEEATEDKDSEEAKEAKDGGKEEAVKHPVGHEGPFALWMNGNKLFREEYLKTAKQKKSHASLAAMLDELEKLQSAIATATADL